MASKKPVEGESASPGGYGRRGRLLLAALSVAAVVLPVLTVRFPPLTDLPQHVAQIRLLSEALDDPGGPYRVQWGSANTLVYMLMSACAFVVGDPIRAGWLTVVGLGLLWTLAAHALAAARGRSGAAAVLASAFFFNHALYWGFLNFLIGWPVFVLWMHLCARSGAALETARPPASDRTSAGIVTSSAPRGRRERLPELVVTAVLLYLAHALWFAAGAAWAALGLLRLSRPLRARLVPLFALLPTAMVAAAWYPQVERSGFVSPTLWSTSPVERLSPLWIADAALGGLRGWSETLLLSLVAVWLIAGLCQHRQHLGAAVDRLLLCGAGCLFTAAILLPNLHSNTLVFASRWLPCGAVLLLLAMPPPRLAPLLLRGIALAVLAAFCMATAASWRTIESREHAGLEEALAAVAEDSRIVGLDFIKFSAVRQGRPFLNTVAYAQALHGGTIHMTFAGFPSSLVKLKQRPELSWTPMLGWFAERVTPQDLAHFDYALINGTRKTHESAATALPLEPVTHTGRWRLYRVVATGTPREEGAEGPGARG